MRCPKCGHSDDKVIDSRNSKGGTVIRRRRECLKCNYRFTTYEEIAQEDWFVIKKDARHEAFSKTKLRGGIEKACEKRPVSVEGIDRLVERIVDELEAEYDREIPSRAIGEKIMKHLRELDEVAYVRFASVYRQFKDINEFVEEIKNLAGQP
jgi:transcriptional repressor NrdR